MGVEIRVTVAEAVQQFTDSYKQSRLVEARRFRDRIKAVKQTARLIGQLATVLPDGCNMWVCSTWALESPIVEVERSALPALRKAVGRLSVQHKSIHDVEKRELSVYLTCEKYPGIQFQYVRPLSTESRCEIVTQTSTYTSLVCKVQ
jgi:hypothetical protein